MRLLWRLIDLKIIHTCWVSCFLELICRAFRWTSPTAGKFTLFLSVWLSGVKEASHSLFSLRQVPRVHQGHSDFRCVSWEVSREGALPPQSTSATLSVKQPRRLLSLFAMRARVAVTVNLLFARMAGAFPSKLLSSQLASSLYWCKGLFLPKHKVFHFPVSMRSLSAHFCSLSKTLWIAAQVSQVSATPPVL